MKDIPDVGALWRRWLTPSGIIGAAFWAVYEFSNARLVGGICGVVAAIVIVFFFRRQRRLALSSSSVTSSDEQKLIEFYAFVGTSAVAGMTVTVLAVVGVLRPEIVFGVIGAVVAGACLYVIGAVAARRSRS